MTSPISRCRLSRAALALVLATVLVTAPAGVAGVAGVAAAAPIRPEALPFGFSDQVVASVPNPTAIKALANGTVAVLEKAGRVRIVRNGVLLPTPALTLSLPGCTGNERGLLGIATGPDLLTTGFVYLFYTRPAPTDPALCVNRVSRFTMANDIIDPGSELVLLDNLSSAGANHNGGDLEIGKDGMLYVSVGDAGTDPRSNSGGSGMNDAARDMSLLNGKILRVDPATGGPAPGNPYPSGPSCRVVGVSAAPTAVCAEIYASGLRNPWRFAFDPNASGVRFFINDVGQGAREEVNDGILGADYGWNIREGQCPQGQNPPCAGPAPGLTDPIVDYSRGFGQFITGGAFIPNGMWPSQFDGAYFFGDGGSGNFWIRTATGTVDFANAFHTLAYGMSDMDFVVESGGLALYYVIAGEVTDTVRKIVFPGQPNPEPSVALRYVPTMPSDRVFDSRRPTDGVAPLAGNVIRTISTGVDGAVTRAVLVNIAYVAPAADGFLRAWQAGGQMPTTSNINALANEVVANAAIVPVDAQGRIDILTNASSHVVIDVLGRFDLADGLVAAGRFVPLPPQRLIDTREPVALSNFFGERDGSPTSVVTAPVRGRVGVPSAGVSAVVLTVTAVAGTISGGGYVTVAPGGTAPPPTSNLNTNDAGDIRPNLVVVPLGADGSIDLHLFRTTDVVVDVTGYFTDATAAASSTGRFRSLMPYREVDTRTPFGFERFVAPSTRLLDPVSVPAGAIAVAHNMTLVNNSAALFLTAFPNEPRPFISSANASGPNQLRATSAFTPLGSGQLRYYSMAATDLVVDVTGYFEG